MSSTSKRLAAIVLLAGLTLPAAAAERTYVLTPASEIRYKGFHTAHNWEGVSKALRGRITISDEARLETPVEVCVPVRSFSSGNRNRDNNALSTIEADRFPKACLTIRQVELLSRRQEGNAIVGQVKVSGPLRFHGVEKPVSVVLDGRLEGNRLKASGTFPIRLSDHQVKRPSLLFVPIDDKIEVVVTLDAVSE